MIDVVIIGGCGHVGLPLGLAFARAGCAVVALDIDGAKVERTNHGVMPFKDRGADEALKEVLAKGTFRCSTDPAVVRDAKVVISVVGTPVDAHLNPRFEGMRDVILEHRENLRAGQLLVLRSTLYPGTTERVVDLLASLKLDVDVAYCPERVAEGQALEEIVSLPQIVAGCTPKAQRRAEALFSVLTKDLIAVTPRAAELAKLYNNAWRYVQFAAANQLFMIANDYGVDFYEVHRAMTERYPRAQGFPRAGFAAGPCLFKDTMQLSAFHNNGFFIGHSAMLLNEGLPNYLVRAAARRFPLREMTVGILGMAFKGDSDDERDSLSFKLRHILVAECREVLCSDPNLDNPGFVPLEDITDRAGLIFIGAPHSEYRGRDFGKVPVIDVWNIVKNRIVVL